MAVSDWEILACAIHMVRRHGEAAREHALMRAETLAVSDAEGAQTWLRILERINTLEAMQPATDRRH